MPSFYKSLHHQLGPLQRALLLSTSPSKVFDRLREASSITSTTSADRSQPIYDLVYDPASLTVHTTVPAIPEPGTTIVEGLGSSESPWTRIEALNVHLQIINTYMATRARPLELERTCKTSRGWWIVWMRLPPSIILEQMSSSSCREAILIRRASDYVTPSARKVSGRFSRELLGSGAASGWVPSKLAEGVGIDARRYIEGLLSLNR
ncbi:hypothetical protein MMC06_005425 [Schaereria dolodes]|nr:hypothetical protein [Schaereria dolodes]